MRFEGRSGQVVLDDAGRNVTIDRQGFTARALWGKTPSNVIPVANIAEVHLETATLMRHGYIALGLDGRRARSGAFEPSVVSDPMCVSFVQRQNAAASEIVRRIGNLIAERALDVPIAAPHQTAPSATGLGMRVAAAALGTGPLDRLAVRVLEECRIGSAEGRGQITVAVTESEIGFRNTLSKAIAYIAPLLSREGVTIANVSGSDWASSHVLTLNVGPSSTGSSLAEQLAQLTALNASGALSDDEFRAAKARLLGT